MALWVTRVGEYGEYEEEFLEANLIAISFDCEVAINTIESYDTLKDMFRAEDPTVRERSMAKRAGQLWRFMDEVVEGDWVVVPFKSQPVIHIAEVAGAYHFLPTGGSLPH